MAEADGAWGFGCAGFNAHLIKPVPSDQLRAFLDQVTAAPPDA